MSLSNRRTHIVDLNFQYSFADREIHAIAQVDYPEAIRKRLDAWRIYIAYATEFSSLEQCQLRNDFIFNLLRMAREKKIQAPFDKDPPDDKHLDGKLLENLPRFYDHEKPKATMEFLIGSNVGTAYTKLGAFCHIVVNRRNEH